MKMRKSALSAVTAALVCLCILLPGRAYSGQDRDGVRIAQAGEAIEPVEAHILIEKHKDDTGFVILDVRTPAEYSGGHIENAVNIDYLSESFGEEVGKLDRSKTYLVHCRSGRRSEAAAGIMEEMGFENVINMQGGILGWQDAGLPVTK